MSKYAINMADQLNKIRMSAHEKLRKESEVVVEVEKPSSLQTAAVDYLSKKEKPHPLGSPKNLNESVTEGKMSDLHMYIKQGKTAKEIGKLMGVDPKTIQKLMSAYDAKNESVELDEAKKIEIVFEPRTIKNQMPKVVAFFKKNHPKFKLTQNMSDDSLTVDGGGKSLARIGKDIFNNYHIKKVVHEEVERKTFSQKVKESVSNFNVESLLAEDNVDVLRSIVKRKSAKPIKFKDGTMTIDMQTANMMLTVLDKVKPANQKKLAAMMNGKKSEFMKVHGFVMKALGK